MRTMHIEVTRNIKKLFKILDIKERVDRLYLHMLTLCKKTKPFRLWDVKFKIINNPKPGKKYLMQLEVYFLEPGEQQPNEKWWEKLFRLIRICGMGNSAKRIIVKRNIKKLAEKDKKQG